MIRAILVNVSSRGILALDDGTGWHVSMDGLSTVRGWSLGSEIEVMEKSAPGAFWQYWAINQSTSERVSVTSSTGLRI